MVKMLCVLVLLKNCDYDVYCFNNPAEFQENPDLVLEQTTPSAFPKYKYLYWKVGLMSYNIFTPSQ